MNEGNGEPYMNPSCGKAEHSTTGCADCIRERLYAAELRVSELEKKLGQIKEAVCRECSGSGEIGLADGEMWCPVCGGSGDPMKPGVFAPKKSAGEGGKGADFWPKSFDGDEGWPT